MIRVIVLKTRPSNDYELLTIMCEIEATLNCQPITMLSNNVEDWCVLSPLSILTSNLHSGSPEHEFNKSDLYMCNYKYVVAVSKQF